MLSLRSNRQIPMWRASAVVLEAEAAPELGAEDGCRFACTSGNDKAAGAAPHFNPMMLLRRAQPAETEELKEWIGAHHYLQSTPPGWVHLLEFLEGRERIGAMLIGKPASRALDADLILELCRVFFVDSAPKNTESQALSMMRKHVRTWLPQIRLLLAYSDPEQGHTGTIYAADGWAPFGMTKKDQWYGWSRHRGRERDETMVTSKRRWVRSP